MRWEKVKLGDIVEFSNGINFGKDAYAKGIKLIGVSNFGNRFFPEYDSLEEITENVVRKNDLLNSGDIVFVRSNGNKELVGRCMLIDNPPDRITYSGFCIRARLKDTTKNDPVFWTYHFKNMAFRRAMSGTAIGANIQNLSQSRLSAYEAYVPEIEVQRKIANILSNYDKMIDNNHKQIKLLEEAAQRLYKEWFVDLRFPGYEAVDIVDGVPKGWHIGTIDEVVVFHDKIRKPLSSMQRANFKGQYRYYGAAGILDYVEKYLFDGTYLLLGEDGSVITTEGTPVLQYVTGKFWVNNHAHVITGKVPFSTEYIYMMFKKMRISDVVTGVAQPKISQARLSEKKVLIPTVEIVGGYHKKVKSMFEHILLLERQMELLVQARDRLLSKLMSGEIEV